MKFKIYGWLTIRKNPPPPTWGINFVPHIDLDVWYADDGWDWTCLMFSWLIVGVTFDWRKEWKNTKTG